MPVDKDLLAEANAAAGRVAGLEDQLEEAKAEYRQKVRRLHLAGASMREVAEALGVSHQRIHQIIEEGGVRRWRRRRDEEPEDPRLCSFVVASSTRSASSSQGPTSASATRASWPR
jgi:DNA-directed RNA polymerase specialized sigma24 family protein